jgi:hypothetical protein
MCRCVNCFGLNKKWITAKLLVKKMPDKYSTILHYTPLYCFSFAFLDQPLY